MEKRKFYRHFIAKMLIISINSTLIVINTTKAASNPQWDHTFGGISNE